MNKTTIHITGNQGIQLLRMARRGDALRAKPAPHHRLSALDDRIAQSAGVHAGSLLASLGVSPRNPLKLLVPNDASRLWSDPETTHVQTQILSVELPQNAFLELLPGNGRDALDWSPNMRIFIPSPALAVVIGSQMLTRAVSQGH